MKQLTDLTLPVQQLFETLKRDTGVEPEEDDWRHAFDSLVCNGRLLAANCQVIRRDVRPLNVLRTIDLETQMISQCIELPLDADILASAVGLTIVPLTIEGFATVQGSALVPLQVPVFQNPVAGFQIPAAGGPGLRCTWTYEPGAGPIVHHVHLFDTLENAGTQQSCSFRSNSIDKVYLCAGQIVATSFRLIEGLEKSCRVFQPAADSRELEPAATIILKSDHERRTQQFVLGVTADSILIMDSVSCLVEVVPV